MEWIIYLGCAGALWQYIPLWTTLLKVLHLDRKPFNCPLCWTWWTSLALTPVLTTSGWVECIFISASAAVLAELLWRKLMTI